MPLLLLLFVLFLIYFICCHTMLFLFSLYIITLMCLVSFIVTKTPVLRDFF